jgi:transposase
MFFRKKSASPGINWQLVESFRNEEGLPRQRIVISLGNASLPEKDLKIIAKILERKLRRPNDFFSHEQEMVPLSETTTNWIDRIYRQIVRDGRYCQSQPVGDNNSLSPQSSYNSQCSGACRISDPFTEEVQIDAIEHENSAVLGTLLPVKAAWESLRISQCLEQLGFSDMQITAAAANIINRLIEPCSEHSLVRWIGTTALPELLGEGVLDFDHKRFYRISDKLLKNKDYIEAHLRDQSRKLFSLERTVILYDLTNTYFEGQALSNRKAQRGNSKEKRNDRPLVVVAMAYDGNGFALAHKTFAGNTNDGASLVEMVAELKRSSRPAADPEEAQTELKEQSKDKKTKTLVVLDAGIANKDNLVMLREAGFSYLVNDTRGRRSRYQKEFSEHAEFKALAGREDVNKKPPVKVRMIEEPAVKSKAEEIKGKEENKEPESAEKPDTVLLCRSKGREEKEQAMFSKAEERFLEQAAKLDLRLKNGRLAKVKKVHQAIGRLKTQNPRVQRYYTIELSSESRPPDGLIFKRKDQEIQEHRKLFGCYVLRTDRQDFEPEELWRVYIGLTQAEEGFRALKTDLGLRPNFHQKEDRVDGHIFITVIAFHLWKWIRQKLDHAGDNRDWVTVRRLLSTHCYSTLIVPGATGAVYHIRKPGRPEAQQQQIYRTLGVKTSNLKKTKVKFGKISED